MFLSTPDETSKTANLLKFPLFYSNFENSPRCSKYHVFRVRDGHETTMLARELVPGDIVVLNIGDRVCKFIFSQENMFQSRYFIFFIRFGSV